MRDLKRDPSQAAHIQYVVCCMYFVAGPPMASHTVNKANKISKPGPGLTSGSTLITSGNQNGIHLDTAVDVTSKLATSTDDEAFRATTLL